MDDKMPWQIFLDRMVKLCQSKDLLETFGACSGDTERMQYITNNNFLNGSVELWLSKNLCVNDNRNTKSSKQANKYKTDGNKAYATGNNDTALKLYCEGLLYATQNELPILLGNRSAVLYRKGEYQQCLLDIEAAIENGFPRDKIWKLYTRKGECLYALSEHKLCISALEQSLKLLDTENFEQRHKIKDLMNDVITDQKDSHASNKENLVGTTVGGDKTSQTQTVNTELALPDLIIERNPKIPNASNRMDLRFNENEGRHFVANSDIEAGTIIISEKPYACVLLPPWYKTHCQHCLHVIKYLYPCKRCTEVRYCSNQCRKESWDSYHYFECGKLSLMEKIGIAHLSLRIILVTDVNELLEETPTPESYENYTNSYKSVYNLLTNSSFMEIEDLMQYSLAALLLEKILDRGKYFKLRGIEKEKCIIVASRLLRHILQLVCNAHAVTSLSYSQSACDTIIEQDQNRIATAIYPTTSLLNHACEPTIINSFRKNQIIVKLTKPVKKGEEIYNCYGPHFRRMGYRERQKALKQQYFFTCNCNHCSSGDTREKEFNCFACSSCKSRIENSICTNCVAEFDLSLTEKMAEEADIQFIINLEDLNSSRDETSIKSILRKFSTCLKLRTHVYYKDHYKLAEIYDVIARCYAMLHDYRNALPYLCKSRDVIKNQYGENSIELTNEILKLTDLYVAIAKQYMNGQTQEHDCQLFQEGLWSVEDGLKLVRLNKEPDCEEIEELKEKLAFLQCALSLK